MKWKIAGFWLSIFAGLWLFFRSFGTATFQRQEEVQLFIPEWGVIREMLALPGGFCTVVGQALVQYYTSPWVVLCVNSALLCLAGLLCYLLLQEIAPRGYNLLLALFPVMGLLKAHTNPFYVLDGTVGLLLLLLFSYLYIRIRRTSVRWLYGVVSMLLLYGMAGQPASLYGAVVLGMELACRRRWQGALAVLLVGALLACIGMRMAVGIPLTDGIYSERYQESQMQPDSYLYFVWIRFALLLLGLIATAFALRYLPEGKRWVKVGVAGGLSVLLFSFSSFCLPGAYEGRNNRMNEWAVLGQKGDWDTLLRACSGKEGMGEVGLNYVNMALARKGLLGDRLFRYDQRGPQSLLATWDRTYYMSCLLSDIHYMIGDISLSEGYAMEGLTLAKRGGSPRMLQRLVQISLIRGELALAGKYIALLSRMPGYRRWAEKYAGYLRHPEWIGQEEELAAKRLPPSSADNLLCLMELDSLWMGHLSAPAANRTAWEYVGCSYLLAKEMEKFKALLSRTGTLWQGQPLPIHFQEAALVLAVEDPSLLDRVAVRREIVQRYQQFRQDILTVKREGEGLLDLYRQYGDTFWFYYYCKKLNG